MITLYLILKLIGWIVRVALWLLLLPFRLIFLPFRILFGKPARRTESSGVGFWDGLLIGSLFF